MNSKWPLRWEQLEDRRLLAGMITPVGSFDTWDGGIIRSTDIAGIGYYAPLTLLN